MNNVSRALKELHRQRELTLDALSRIDQAIAALSGLEALAPQPRHRAKRMISDEVVVMVPKPAPHPSPVAVATPEKRGRSSGFKLSEDHRQRLLEGRRKARDKKEDRREPIEPGSAAVEQWKAEGPPRLVKPKQPLQEFVVEREQVEAVS